MSSLDPVRVARGVPWERVSRMQFQLVQTSEKSMADEEVQQDEGESDAESPRKRSLLPLLGTGAALVVGLVIGLWLVGPAAAERLAGPSEPDAAVAEGAAEHRESSPVTSFTVENLILNPAETQGTRFLMATIVVSVEGDRGAEALGERDAEIRDHLMLLLGAKTVDELTDVGHRDELKEEIRAALAALVPSQTIVAVYLPTFVIQ